MKEILKKKPNIESLFDKFKYAKRNSKNKSITSQPKSKDTSSSHINKEETNSKIVTKEEKKPKRTLRKFTSNSFDYTQDFKNTDFRNNPHLYQIGKGEQGVLLVEPYKSEILPYWRFKTPEIAKESSNKIYQLFEGYLKEKDFIGADMARKFLQMGYTRSRRYANYKGGRKFTQNPQYEETKEKEIQARKKYQKDRLNEEDQEIDKVESAKIFKEVWFRAKDNHEYLKQKEQFKEKYYVQKNATSKS